MPTATRRAFRDGPVIDIADRLPPAGRARLLAARDDKVAVGAIVRDLAERVRTVRDEKREAERTVADYLDLHKQFRMKETDAPVAAKRAEIARLADELARLDGRHELGAARSTAIGQLIRATEEDYLEALPADVALADFEMPAPQRAKGESAADEIGQLRNLVADLKADIAAVRSAPITSDMAKARMREQIETLARHGAPNAFQLVENGELIAWRTHETHGRLVGLAGGTMPLSGSAIHHEPDLLGLLAWVHHDALIARLDREIAEISDDAAALTDELRAAKLAELRERLLAGERLEAAAVEAAGEVQRADLDPRAWLQISGPAPTE